MKVALLLSMAAVAAAQSTCPGLEYNVDYAGSDITYTERATAAECTADCASTPGCKLFVWYQNQCWLKSNKGEQKSLPDRVSCVLTPPAASTLVCPGVYYNVDYEGHDIGSTTRQSADECTADCQNTPGCKLFVWFEGQCWLKSSKGATRYLPGRNSCVLETSTPSTATCPGLEFNVDYAGYDILYTDRNSAAECTADCQKTLGCKAFVWFQNQCWLKNQLGERKELSDRISCVLKDSDAVAPTTTTTTTSAPTVTTTTTTAAPITTTNAPDFQGDDETEVPTQKPTTVASTTTSAAPTTTTTTAAPRPSEPIKPLETGPRGTAAPAGTLEPWDSQGTPEPTTDVPDYDDYAEPPATTVAPTTTTLKPLETGPRGTAAPAGTLEPWDSQGTPEPTTDLPDTDDYLDNAVANRAIVSKAQVEAASFANTQSVLALGAALAGMVVVALAVVLKRPSVPTPTAERKRLLQV